MNLFTPPNADVFVVESCQSRSIHQDQFNAECARLNFEDWLGRSCSVYVERLVPKTGAACPGIVHAVGATQQVKLEDQLFWAERGYACATFDWQIADVVDRPPEKTSRWPDKVVSQYHGQEDLEQAMIPLALQAAMVTLSWLSGHPSVDAGRLGMSGISWGGYLTWLTAAYDKRIKAIVPVYGCGILESDEAAHHRPLSEEVRDYWKTFWDPPSLVTRQTAPVAYLSGTNDFFGDMLTADRMLKQLSVPHRWSLLPNANHAIGPGESALASAWMDHYLKDGTEVPRAPSPEFGNETMGRSESPQGRVDVWWTFQGESSRQNCWQLDEWIPAKAAMAFKKCTYPDGLSLCSPLFTNREPSPPVKDRSDTWKNLVNGTGWRWELGSTQMYGNSVEIRPIGNGEQIQVRPSPGDPDAPVAICLNHIHHLEWKPETGEILEFNWSQENPPARVEAVITRVGGAYWVEEFFACQQEGNTFQIHLPEEIKWSEVATLRISAVNQRRTFIFGPLRKRKA